MLISHLKATDRAFSTPIPLRFGMSKHSGDMEKWEANGLRHSTFESDSHRLLGVNITNPQKTSDLSLLKVSNKVPLYGTKESP